MGRQVRRVPLDFNWPLDKVWTGYLMPDRLHETPCSPCGRSGYSDHARALQDLWYGNLPFDPATTGSTPWTPETPDVRSRAEQNVARAPEFYGTGEVAIRREAARLADFYNEAWSHHLSQDDVDALIAADRLWDFTHTWTKSEGWKSIEPAPTVTAEQVNLWSISGMGHDGINCHAAVKARCEREGVALICSVCGGRGSAEAYPGQRAEAEAWESTDPPEGDGWQLWETVSEGSPISPVFATADMLAGWMADPARGDRWLPLPAAQQFVQEGWAPTLVVTPETGVASGAEWVGMADR